MFFVMEECRAVKTICLERLAKAERLVIQQRRAGWIERQLTGKMTNDCKESWLYDKEANK